MSSPGQKLQKVLQEIYPLITNSGNSFVSDLDSAFYADGELIQLTYNSCINYLVRRLINTSYYIKRKYSDPSLYPDERYIIEIRRFLKDYTKIPAPKRELIVELLKNSLETKEKLPTDGARNKVLAQAKNNNHKCYICGQELDFSDKTKDNYATADHIWPRTLGGSNGEENLKVACKICNENKKFYIDTSDFHYEEMCPVNDIENKKDFFSEVNRMFRIALWSKNNYACSYPGCGRLAEDVGLLEFIQIDQNDSWHVVNVQAYCSQHAQRKRRDK